MRFSEILALATAVSGIIVIIDAILWKHKRMLGVLTFTPEESGPEPWLIEIARSFFPIFLSVFILRSFIIEPFRIPSSSMVPTLLVGDFILVNKFEYGLREPITNKKIIGISHPKRGDMIVFRRLDKDLIKRVVGLPGDKISYRDKALYINGKMCEMTFKSDVSGFEPRLGAINYRQYIEDLHDHKHAIYLDANYDGGRIAGFYRFTEVTVPHNAYYVLGDNRDKSEDSRFWGFVKDEDIQGRAFAIWMSWDNMSKEVRWDRIGTRLQ